MAANAQAEASNEALTVSAYPTATPWTQITDTTNGQMVERQWLPASKNGAEATEVLTEQAYSSLKGVAPLNALNALAAQTKSTCADFKTDSVLTQSENGYLTAYAMFYCIRASDPSHEIISYLKAIGGKSALYVVKYEMLRPADPSHKAGVITSIAFDEAFLNRLDDARNWLEHKVQLCPPADGSACPRTPAVVASFFLSGDNADPADVSKVYGWTAGKTTLAEVESKFGKAMSRVSGPEGRFANVYIPEKYSPVVCVFNKSNVLTTTLADKK